MLSKGEKYLSQVDIFKFKFLSVQNQKWEYLTFLREELLKRWIDNQNELQVNFLLQ